MAPIGTLYIANNNQVPGKVIRAVAAITGSEVTIASDYVHFETNKKPEFLAKFAYGKVPALELTSGQTITEGIAIARYRRQKQLLGTTVDEEALVDQWQNFTYTELQPRVLGLSALYSHATPYNKQIEISTKDTTNRALEYLNSHLASHTFVATERLTVADLALASILYGYFRIYIDAAARTKWPNIQRYFETVINQPKLKEVFGEPEYAEKAATYTAPTKEEKKAKA
ncbi:glutathione S-transferase C-terminal-like protein [Auriculariales sp. MPI-PUGE-AT-0066]|nr:glutathione S-transferase C-terminal-like protein [Auriculariales sp. MPI-PUGE-AT-0066]